LAEEFHGKALIEQTVILPFLVRVPTSPNDVIDQVLSYLYHVLNNFGFGGAGAAIDLDPAPKQPSGSGFESAEDEVIEWLDLISCPAGI
jgi:hypothetical protein